MRHSITSSAREPESESPSVAAVLVLITNSYLPGTSTGNSAGLAPRSCRAKLYSTNPRTAPR